MTSQPNQPGQAALEARFLAKVKKTDGCWVWVGINNGFGYGRFHLNGKRVRAHRLSYQLFVGNIPEGMQIDHICHNRMCVNPSHLRLATHAENMRNRVRNSNNKSGFKNVYASKSGNRWLAHIKVDSKIIRLGSFDTPELAHSAYCDAATQLHGEFANFG